MMVAIGEGICNVNTVWRRESGEDGFQRTKLFHPFNLATMKGLLTGDFHDKIDFHEMMTYIL